MPPLLAHSRLSWLRLPQVCWRHRELLASFVVRDLKARYEGSLLGRLWPLLNPLILFAVYYFVFALILGMRLEQRGVAVGDTGLMGLYIISGLLPWLAFSDGVIRATGVVLENANLVKKIAFPSELLPVYAVTVHFVYFLIGLALFLVVRLVFFYEVGSLRGLPPSWPILLPTLLLHCGFTVGLGLFLGSLNIFLRDTQQFVPLALNLWFFTTPIVYPSSLIEQRLPELAWTLKLNPMYHLMELYRSALVYDFGRTPWQSLGWFALATALVLFPGYAFFLATKGRFADEL